MIGLFRSLESRFNGNPTLLRLGRKLFEGFEDQRVNATRPYVEVNPNLPDRADTFDSDVEVWNLPFRYHAKDLRTTAATDWIEAMENVYRDANLFSPFFSTCGCRMMEAAVPSLANGIYEAAVRFQLTLQRTANVPLLTRI